MIESLRLNTKHRGSDVTFEILSGSCDGGDCPTFFIDRSTGVVRVRGTDPETGLERDVDIDPAPWARLIAGLGLAAK